MTLLAYHPFKALYVLSALAFELTRLPFWTLKYLLPRGRQHPKWSFRQALSMRVFYAFLAHAATVQVKTPLPLTPGREKDRWVIMKLREEWKTLFKGPLLGNGRSEIVPGDVGGTWYTKNKAKSGLRVGDNMENVLVILHIHGGAYVVGNGRTTVSSSLTSTLFRHTRATHILMPQYRLSTLPASRTSNPFPAALQDSLTSYLYLLRELKVPARNIVLSGDSAGANNAVALLRYIAEYGADLDIPTPRAALLWSPWINPHEGSVDGVLKNPNYISDYLSPAFTQWGHRAYAGLSGAANLDTPYVNHKLKMFRTETPLFVNAGSAEILYFDAREWAREMAGVQGNRVTWDEEEAVPHDMLLMGDVLGFGGSVERMGKRVGEWLGGITD
ncbi:alpha/beta-hydrolase [Byssothecium circinans]|uniref:Alpha/beta-hydrolase n=1 Tax=Byssothecium circinans TaxID=147558 RepID=A0A6A5UBZ7_9PLEO|nr:alpha/beta-hydrolase [Byssothecium circinans]